MTVADRSPRTGDGLRLALGTFSVVRVARPVVGPATVAAALRWAPLVGAAMGAAAGLLVEGVRAATHHSVAGSLLGSALAVTTLAVLSRAIHWDGLADTADALGSARPPEQALEVMRRSDVGPFGVVTVVFVLLLQVSATAVSVGRHNAWLSLVVAAAASRAAVAEACVRGVPAARPDGLGAAFAGALSRAGAAGVVLVTALALGAVAVADGDRGWPLSLRAFLAALAAAAAGLLVVRRCVRRLGGVTGDVMGAVVELGAVTAMLCFALL
jgi:adenosylcobinamide-GDP ribazoletransferase